MYAAEHPGRTSCLPLTASPLHIRGNTHLKVLTWCSKIMYAFSSFLWCFSFVFFAIWASQLLSRLFVSLSSYVFSFAVIFSQLENTLHFLRKWKGSPETDSMLIMQYHENYIALVCEIGLTPFANSSSL